MKRRLDGSILVSLAIHLVVVTAVLHAILTPRYLEQFFRPRTTASSEEPTERLRYIEMPPAGVAAAPVAAESFQPGPVAATPPLVAPTVVPE